MAELHRLSKESVVVVFTGDGKGKTSASLGLLVRALGAGQKVAFLQFIKNWQVSEHQFIKDIKPVYKDRLFFYKGGLGFFKAGELSSSASNEDHQAWAQETYDLAYKVSTSGDYDLVICDEINNSVHDGLIELELLQKIIKNKSPQTSLCLTGRNFPKELIPQVDIATDMTKLKHHYDDGELAIKGIDY